MLRSATVDEDDGWSTDFSLSDEDMGETYLDHVEVSFLSLIFLVFKNGYVLLILIHFLVDFHNVF